ncbi:MAG: hypothetical protein A2026_13185 [Deltaproteobacteria bacterium RBG_19FT_COMBO_46_12]|nr:MAG: hypothetical protein A2026_13185 [Deltaproteobacteria bacterium RBG_19FT_COMBO_46_12]
MLWHWGPLINQKLIVKNLCFQKELTKGGLGGEQEFKGRLPPNSGTKHRVSERGGSVRMVFNSTYRVGPAFIRIISSFFLKERDLSFLLSFILS